MSSEDRTQASKAVQRWLLFLFLSVFTMLLLGGITRLTGSGLSITEWQPLAGALPPLHEADWFELFAKYQRSPEFREVNHWMTLADFKRIFFWEYVHRLVGRLIGVAVLAPFAYFVWKRELSPRLTRGIAILFVLGGLQGLLGWLMVKSGLGLEPRVSHFRLAAHLDLALVTGQFALWLALDARAPRDPARAIARSRVRAIVGFLGLLFLQVTYGALMAGTHAGYYAATFPDMNGQYAPDTFFGSEPLRDALTSPLAIHYIHRALGFGVLAYALALAVYFSRASPRAVARAAQLVAALAFVQLNLGAATVLSRVALPWAIVHQALAFVLCSTAVLLLHCALGARPVTEPRLSYAEAATTHHSSRSPKSQMP